MKILFLTTSFRLDNSTDAIGGGEISNRILMQKLGEKNHVQVISIHGNGFWGESYKGIKLFDVSTRVKGSLFKKERAMILYKKYASKIYKDFNPDIILSATTSAGPAIRLGKSYGTPAGLIVRAYENISMGDRIKGTTSFIAGIKDRIKAIIFGGFQGEVLEELDFFIANSQYMESFFSNYSGVTTSFVYTPTISIKQKEFQKIDSISNVVMVGTSAKKGTSIFKSVAANFTDIEFQIIGDKDVPAGEYKKAGDNLKVFGWIRDQAEFLDIADLVLVPSLWDEPYGRIAVEALKFGKIVLVANVGGLPETVNYNENLIVENNSTDAWVNALRKVLKSPGLYKSESEKVSKQLNNESDNSEIKMLNNFLKSLIDK